MKEQELTDTTMNIILTAFGSTGDVLPLLALGKALKKRGHHVQVLSSPNYGDLFFKHNLPFSPVGFDIQKIMENNSREIYSNFLKLILSFRTLYNEFISEQFYGLMAKASRETDLIIGSGLSVASKSVAELLNIRYHHGCYYPVVYQSRYFPPPIIPYQNLPHWMNSFFWYLQKFMLKMLYGQSLNQIRVKHSLPKIEDFLAHINGNSILACSKELITVPSDVNVKYFHTDYWYFNDEREILAEISTFINHGQPPIYIGFGSMTDPSPEKTSKLLIELTSNQHYRFVISKGWAKLDPVIRSENVMAIDYVPFLKLFPKMAVIIHHGGAGTTHCAARSGTPQIIVPHMIDQYYWGQRIADLQIGSKPIMRSRLTSDSLTNTIEIVLSSREINSNAKLFGKIIKEHDGISETIKLIEEMHLQ